MENVENKMIRKIPNGTVIDHIPAGYLERVERVLKLGTRPRLSGEYLPSGKYGQKAFLKIPDFYLDREIARILAFIAPTATFNTIHDYKVTEKYKAETPTKPIVGLIKCPNVDSCISNDVREKETITTVFTPLPEEQSLQCGHCDRLVSFSEVHDYIV